MALTGGSNVSLQATGGQFQILLKVPLRTDELLPKEDTTIASSAFSAAQLSGQQTPASREEKAIETEEPPIVNESLTHIVEQPHPSSTVASTEMEDINRREQHSLLHDGALQQIELHQSSSSAVGENAARDENTTQFVDAHVVNAGLYVHSPLKHVAPVVQQPRSGAILAPKLNFKSTSFTLPKSVAQNIKIFNPAAFGTARTVVQQPASSKASDVIVSQPKQLGQIAQVCQSSTLMPSGQTRIAWGTHGQLVLVKDAPVNTNPQSRVVSSVQQTCMTTQNPGVVQPSPQAPTPHTVASTGMSHILAHDQQPLIPDGGFQQFVQQQSSGAPVTPELMALLQQFEKCKCVCLLSFFIIL